jgi:hypothetical protein
MRNSPPHLDVIAQRLPALVAPHTRAIEIDPCDAAKK